MNVRLTALCTSFTATIFDLYTYFFFNVEMQKIKHCSWLFGKIEY